MGRTAARRTFGEDGAAAAAQTEYPARTRGMAASAECAPLARSPPADREPPGVDGDPVHRVPAPPGRSHGRASPYSSDTVVRLTFPRTRPESPCSRISRSNRTAHDRDALALQLAWSLSPASLPGPGSQVGGRRALVSEWVGTQDALDVVERLHARCVVAAPSYRMDQSTATRRPVSPHRPARHTPTEPIESRSALDLDDLRA